MTLGSGISGSLFQHDVYTSRITAYYVREHVPSYLTLFEHWRQHVEVVNGGALCPLYQHSILSTRNSGLIWYLFVETCGPNDSSAGVRVILVSSPHDWSSRSGSTWVGEGVLTRPDLQTADFSSWLPVERALRSETLPSPAVVKAIAS